jgi:circadian clock protein KaiC
VTGSARAAREVQEEAALIEQKNKLDRKKRELERKRKVMQAKIEELKSGFETDREELERLAGEGREQEKAHAAQRGVMARLRMAQGETK